MLIDALLMNVIEIAGRVDASLPITLPSNWRPVKDVAAVAHYADPTLYRLCREGALDSVKLGGRVAVDVGTLADRLGDHLAQRKKRK